MPLNPKQKLAISGASSSDVEQFFRDLIPHFGNRQWLSPSNRYSNDCVRRLKTDIDGGTVVGQDICEYIAASAPIHCVDGWTYWGRALDALCRGDSDSSRHLAYYAELRAAMSFLATQGIGIFDHLHIIISSGRTWQVLPPSVGHPRPKFPGTHEVTWYILEHWPTLPGSDKALLEVISPQGVDLAAWVNEFHGSSFLGRALTKDWLNTWGFDLRRFAFDQQSRNQSSYRPTQYPNRSHPPATEISKFISEVWRMLEPAASPFKLLDDHLLRLSLQFAFKARTGKSHISDPKSFQADVARTVGSLLSGNSEAPSIGEFIMGRRDPELPRLLSEAGKFDIASHPGHHFQVIARAALLLRIASGFVERLLVRSGVTKSHLEFWLNEFIVNRGLWKDPAIPPDKLTDLWSDIGESLLEEESWQLANAGSSPSLADWREGRIDSVARLGEGERVVTWSWRLQ